MKEGCPRKWQGTCPRKEHHRANHHIYYPASQYTTETERQFRNLPENLVQMCKHVEEQIHALQPEGPPKPTDIVMEHCVGQRAIKLALAEERP